MNGTTTLVIVFCGVVGSFILLAVLLDRLSKPKADNRWSAGIKRVGAVVEGMTPKKLRRRRRSSDSEAFPVRVVRSLASLWRLGDTSQSRLQEMLVHAGIREKGAVEVFLGAKFALALALPAATVAFMLWHASAVGSPLNYRNLFMYSCIGLVVGLMIPNLWLRNKAKNRAERIRYSLPDALDLMIVCVESGLGLDAAMVRISREMAEAAPELCEELVLMNLEISAGKPRDDCLRNLALRSGCDEVESLTARINQAARFGTNLGNSLRIHSESLRQKRRQEAEERAAKTTVKLLFPLVFFVFPAIFVVILGPALVKLARMFL
jgi:tight adherence protein C